MSRLNQAAPRGIAAAAALVAALAAGVYAFVPASHLTADSGAAQKTAPAVTLGHANALSQAFRNSADQVLPAVVSIRNESQPKVVRRELPAPHSGRSQIPNLPKEFGDLDPLLKRFF